MSTSVSNVCRSSEWRASSRNHGRYTFIGPGPNVSFERVCTVVTGDLILLLINSMYKTFFLWVSLLHRRSTTNCVEAINPLNHIINLNWKKESHRCTFSCTSYEERNILWTWQPTKEPLWIFAGQCIDHLVKNKKAENTSCVGAAHKVSPNWSLETVTCHSSHCFRGIQREYSSKPLKNCIVKRILVFKR